MDETELKVRRFEARMNPEASFGWGVNCEVVSPERYVHLIMYTLDKHERTRSAGSAYGTHFAMAVCGMIRQVYSTHRLDRLGKLIRSKTHEEMCAVCWSEDARARVREA